LFEARRAWALAWIGPTLSLFINLAWPPAAGQFTWRSGTRIAMSSTAAATVFFSISVALLVIGYAWRNQTYKAHWRGMAVSPEGYRKGVLAWITFYEFSEFACFYACMDRDHAAWYFSLTFLSAVLLIMHFPSGKPMQPHPPRVGNA
jgi:hypothetical protein